MYFSVDKISGKLAELVGEDKKPLTVKTSMLPPGTRQGEMLYYNKGRFFAAPDKTAERRTAVANMLEKLLKNSVGED